MTRFNKSRFAVGVRVGDESAGLMALFQTLTKAFIIIEEGTWAGILDGSSSPDDSDTIDTLYDQGILVKEGVNETDVFEFWKQQYVHDLSALKSKVLVTRKCNNRCRYCILDLEEEDMTPETAEAMDNFYIDMIREKNPQTVDDDYLGGEPLLRSDLILKSSGRRSLFCKERGIEYGFSMTTNGTLIKKSIISEMIKNGLTGIRVSMSGPAPVHDYLRPSKNGDPTYKKIIKNLQSISEMISIGIECQYDSGSEDYRRIPEMLDDFVAHDIVVKDIAYTPILPRRGENPFNNGTGDPEKFLYLKHEAEKRGYPVNEDAPFNACMADFRCRLIFDTDGSIIPCPSLQRGEFAIGNVFTGIDFVEEALLRKRNLPDKCINECEILPICMGGCRLQAFIPGGDFHGVDCHYDNYIIFLEDYIQSKTKEALAQSG